MDNHSLPPNSRCNDNTSPPPINQNDRKRKHHPFHFPLLNFEKFFSEEVEFSLPASFMIKERQNEPCQNVNMTLDKVPDDENSTSYSSTFSNKKTKHSNTDTTINTKLKQKKSSPNARTRVRKSRKSSRTLLKFGEQPISLLPEVNYENYNNYNHDIVNTPLFTEKMSTSSVFVDGSIEMETTQAFDEKFLENCFSAHVSTLLLAAEYLDER
ncbi:785_t:CDS:2 [Ambispora leptoticha]|uniref:785_t:CDS:1 n=1 Tax=Ambispora leptoticha TaxID=144679 RepID=A0A9N9BT73_9GLOM|nr:785_t:CDS:2 [Ambispora leptoticha]